MCERLGIRTLVAVRKLARSPQNILVGRQSFQSHRAASMQLASRDADLGPESIPIPVRETSRGVVKDSCGVDLCQKTLSRD